MGRVRHLRGDGHEAEPVHERTDYRDLREQGAGAKTADVCRKHGISSAIFYKRKAKYGGLEVPDAKRPKVLEDENVKLKKLLAVTMLDNAVLKDVVSKNGDARRQARGRRSPSGRV